MTFDGWVVFYASFVSVWTMCSQTTQLQMQCLKIITTNVWCLIWIEWTIDAYLMLDGPIDLPTNCRTAIISHTWSGFFTRNICHTKGFSDSREKRDSSREKLEMSWEKRDSSREKRETSREKRDSSREKRDSSREKRDSSREKRGERW